MLNAIQSTAAERRIQRPYVPTTADRAERTRTVANASASYLRDSFEPANAAQKDAAVNRAEGTSQADGFTEVLGKVLDAVKNLLSALSSYLSGGGSGQGSGATGGGASGPSGAPAGSATPGATPQSPGTDPSDDEDPTEKITPSGSPQPGDEIDAAGGTTPLPGEPMKVDHVEATHDYSVKQTTKDGRNAWRFEVRDGDVQQWDQHNVGPGGKPNQRAEISYAPAADSAKRNSPYNATPESGVKTYSMGVNFEKGWPNDQRWATLMQFHPQESPGVWGFSGINVHGDRIDIPKPFAPDGEGQDIWSAKIEPGKWYDIQLQVKWSTGNDGYVNVMVNGEKVGSYQGKTIAPGEAYYLKQGYYRDGAIDQPGVVYQTPITVS